MNFTHLAIQDAGMLFDLMQAQLFSPAFELSYTFCISDLALASLEPALREQLMPYVHSGKMLVMPCTQEDQDAVRELAGRYPRLCAAEWSVYHMARTHQWPMLASCTCLYTWNYVPPIKLLNMTWLIKELLIQAKITQKSALTGIDQLVKANYRLGAECISLRKIVGNM